MPRKKGKDPTQFGLFAVPLDAMIPADAEVRVIAAFVDQLDLTELGFRQIKSTGASAYGPEVLLKLYIYGYLNRVRSSRLLNRECRINVEVMWLTGRLQPCYHTIADFRKDHPAALKKVFKEYVTLLRDWNLITGKRLAADGTRIHGSNARKKNFNDAKLKRHLDRLDTAIEQTLAEFDARDAQEDSERKTELQTTAQDKLASLKQRKSDYEKMRKELAESDESQLSLTDADARSLMKKGRESLVGYNIQSVVDADQHLIVHVEATNTTDINALAGLAAAAKEVITKEEGAAADAESWETPPESTDPLEFLADTGYHNATQLAGVEALGFTPYVAERKQVKKGRATSGYGPEDFTFDAARDVYVCPAGYELSTNGTWHQRRKKTTSETGTSGGQRTRNYRCPKAICDLCPLKDQCLSDAQVRQRSGKVLSRHEHAAAVTRNRARLAANPDIYRQRQTIVEHPFGTIKRHWTGYYTLLRSKEKVDGEYNLFALCYNLRRSMSILGNLELIRGLKALKKTIFKNIAPSGSTVCVVLHLSPYSSWKMRGELRESGLAA